MKTEKTASAERPSAPNAPPPRKVVEGVKLTRHRLEPNAPALPVAKYKASVAPNAGDLLEFALDNGVSYRGEVADATVVDGEVLVEFRGDLQPEPK